MISQEELLGAKKKAMMLLEYRDRTEKELEERLLRAGFSSEAAQGALAYVKSYGYLDDDRFARNYISYRMEEKSRQRLLQELGRKGVSRARAEAAYEAVCEEKSPDEEAMIRRVLERKCQPQEAVTDKQLRSIYGYFLRRGFRYDQVSSVLEELGISRKG